MKQVIFLILVSMNFIVKAQENEPSAFSKGVKLLKAKQYILAEEQFSIAIREEQTDKLLKMAYIYRGFALNGQRKFDKAILDFNEAIEIDSTDAASYMDRGKTYSYLRDYENAVSDFQKVLTIDTIGRQAEAAFYYLGRIKLIQFEYQEGIDYFTQLIELSPQNAEAYFLRGVAKGNLTDIDGAISDYDLAIKYRPDYMEAYANRGTQKINKIPTEDKIGKKIKCLEEPCADLLKAKALGDTTVDDMLFLYCKKCK